MYISLDGKMTAVKAVTFTYLNTDAAAQPFLEAVQRKPPIMRYQGQCLFVTSVDPYGVPGHYHITAGVLDGAFCDGKRIAG